jgi:hypothetical protein
MPTKPLLRQNSELRVDRIWNWTLPAYAVRLTDGRTMNVCPNAGACAKFCYALNGTYLFKNVRGAHEQNLRLVLDHLNDWKWQMIEELRHKRFRPTGKERLAGYDLQLDEWTELWRKSGGAAVRIHDSGDFFSTEYLQAWIDIAIVTPDVLFYAYTKEVTRFREHAVGKTPMNFKWVYSMGGKEDSLIDKDTERHADVFPDLDAIDEAGYVSQAENDLLCVLLPTTRIGIPANNIRHFNKKMERRSFSQLETERENFVAEKKERANADLPV